MKEPERKGTECCTEIDLPPIGTSTTLSRIKKKSPETFQHFDERHDMLFLNISHSPSLLVEPPPLLDTKVTIK